MSSSLPNRPRAAGHDDHGVARLDSILAAGDNDLAAAVNGADQQVFAQPQLLQRHAAELRALRRTEFQRLGLSADSL